MNFKIQQTYPSPTQGLSKFNTLTYASDFNLLVLYGEQKQQQTASSESQQQPKKKITFKSDKNAQPATTDKISIFSLNQRKWQIIQAKGKIPNSRCNFTAIYMKPCIIIYGGKCNNKNVNQVYALNCQTWTWKKLFSLDGPPSGDKFLFFKVSNTMAGLIVEGVLWTLNVADVKWELTSNQLPGSVWQKTNIILPNNIQFCWVLNENTIIAAGVDQAIKINLTTKEIISEFRFNFNKILMFSHGNANESEKQNNIIEIFQQTVQRSSSNPHYCAHIIINGHQLSTLLYKAQPHEQIDLLEYKQQKLQHKLEKQLKCCTFVKNNNKDSQNKHQQQQNALYFLDTKNQLMSISLKIQQFFQNHHHHHRNNSEQQYIQQQEEQPKTSRLITQQKIKNNSFIREQQNQQSSVVPSSHSRIQPQNQHQNYYHSNNNNNNIHNQIVPSDQELVDSRIILESKNDKGNINRNININRNQNQNQRRGTGNLNHNQQFIDRRQLNRPAPYQINRVINNNNTNSSNPQIRSRHEPTNDLSSQSQSHSQSRQQSSRLKQETSRKQNYSRPLAAEQNQISSPHNQNIQQNQLKQNLQRILYNQSIKRKFLQTKIQVLQQSIKKSQKFVLILNKYGNQSQKLRHIQTIKQIKQKLQINWGKQSYFRREMEDNRMPSQVSQMVRVTMSNIEI